MNKRYTELFITMIDILYILYTYIIYNLSYTRYIYMCTYIDTLII